MSEPTPTYDAGPTADMPPDLPPSEAVMLLIPDILRAYFEREREATIMKLRMLDRVLGRRQTIPERTR